MDSVMKILKNDKRDILIKEGENVSFVEVFDSMSCTKLMKFSKDVKGKYLLISYKSDINIKFISIGENIDIEIYCLLLGESGVKNSGNFVCELNNSGCKATVYTLSFLLDNSDVNLDGGIIIGENIQNIEGYLLEENVILGENIKIKTLPLLEVRSNNVKASHGAKIHKLNPEKMFYMESKGLSSKQSRKLIVEGYINNVFDLFSGDDDDENIEIEKIKNVFLKRLLS